MDKFAETCFEVACNGEINRGLGGLLYADEQHIAYVFLHELSIPDDFREQIEQSQEEDDAKKYFILIQKETNNLHVLKIQKSIYVNI